MSSYLFIVWIYFIRELEIIEFNEGAQISLVKEVDACLQVTMLWESILIRHLTHGDLPRDFQKGTTHPKDYNCVSLYQDIRMLTSIVHEVYCL